MNEEKIHIQLGDILRINNPLNEILHNETFYVDYVDNEIINIINTKTYAKTVLKISTDGIIGNGTIKEIKLIHRNSHSGYARQHNLLPGQWIDVHFGGDIPSTFTAKITNLEEDMIELNTTDDELLFINFDYKGIPLDLPIKYIELRNKPQSLKNRKEELIIDEFQGQEKEETKSQKEELETLKQGEEQEQQEQQIDINIDIDMTGNEDEGEDEDAIDKTVDDTDKDKLEQELKEADNIIIFNRKQKGFQVEEFKERGIESEIFTIEEQIDSLQDDLLASVPTSERTNRVMNNININLERYQQLREHFSIFDEYNIIIDKIIKGATYKPLQKYFKNLDKTLYWLIPIVAQEKQIYTGTNTEETSQYYKEVGVFNQMRQLIDLKNEANNGTNENQTNYSRYHQMSEPHFSPFKNLENNPKTIVKIPVSADMHAMTENSDKNDFTTIAIHNRELSKKKFNFDRYVTGLKHLDVESITRERIIANRVSMTSSNIMDITSFISLPEPIIRFSKINLPKTSVLDRSLLNTEFINYWKVFRSNLLLKKKNINLLEPENIMEANNDQDKKQEEENKENSKVKNKNKDKDKEDEQKYYLPPTIFKDSLTQYKLNMTKDEMNEFSGDIYDQYVDRVVPKTKFIFNMMRTFMNDNLTFYNLVKYMEPFLIYTDDISYKLYVAITKYIRYNVRMYAIKIEEAKKTFSFLYKHKDKDFVDRDKAFNLASLIDFENGLDIDVIDDTIESKYGISNYKGQTSSEYYRIIMLKDNLKLYSIVITLQNLYLTYPNDFTPFFRKEREKYIEKSQNDNDTKCANVIVAKRYSTIDALEKDNNKELLFDRKYDKTNYHLLDSYEKEINLFTEEKLKEHITNDLMKKQKLSLEDATKLMTDLIQGHKLVDEGHYAILERESPAPTKYLYYVRNKKVWVIDKELNDTGTELDNTDSLCNIQETCIRSENDSKIQLNNELAGKCQSVTQTHTNIKKQLLDKMINEFDEKYYKSKQERKEFLENKLIHYWDTIQDLSRTKTKNTYKYNDYKYNLSLSDGIVINTIVSPFSQLLSLILEEPDIIKKSQYIIKFVKNYTRKGTEYLYDSNNYVIDFEEDYDVHKESEHWLYCKITNTPLLPDFRHKMAASFLESPRSYTNFINGMKSNSDSKLSDDGDWWVDSNTGWNIVKVDLDVEEGFENDRRVVTRDIIEEDAGNRITLNKTSKSNASIETVFVSNIINSISVAMGINIVNESPIIIRIVSDLMKEYTDAESFYKKSNKIPFQDYYNTNIMFITLGTFISVIQTIIPSIKTRKTHPGCIRSFTGYPLTGDGDDSSIEYLACIVYDNKSSYSPWSALKKNKKETIVKKIKKSLDMIVLTNLDIKRRIDEKLQYLATNTGESSIPQEHQLSHWKTFLPPLIHFKLKEIDNITDNFKDELVNNLKTGSSEQREKIAVVQSKIIYYSLLIQRKINDICTKEEAFLYTSRDEPYLENTCCRDSKNNTYSYFISKDKSIEKYNKTINKLYRLIQNIQTYSSPSLLISKENTKNIYPNVSNVQNEETIFSAFIHFCRFNYDLPIPTHLQPICHRKPTNNIYLTTDSISTKIKKLKDDGFDFDINLFLRLLKNAHKENSVFIDIDADSKVISPLFKLISSIESTINNSNEDNKQIQLDIDFITQLQSVINDTFFDTFLINYRNTGDAFDSANNLNDFLFDKIIFMKNETIKFLNRFSSKNNSLRASLKYVKNFDVWSLKMSSSERLKLLKNYIYYFSRIFPKIVLNNSECHALPKQLYKGFSASHRDDIAKKLNAYYEPLQVFKTANNMKKLLENISLSSHNIIQLADSICCYRNIILNNGNVLSSTFSEETCNLILNYLFIFMIHQITLQGDNKDVLYFDNKEDLIQINLEQQFEELSLDIEEEINIDVVQGEMKDLKRSIASLIQAYFAIFSTHKDMIDHPYQDITEYIYNLKEKEKNIITDRQENLKDEERDVDGLMQKHKLGVWGKGLDKGLTKYVKENYDAERTFRDEMAKIEDAVKQKNSNSNNIDDLIYDELIEEQNRQDIENDAYDMSNIGEDGEIMYEEENYD